MRFQNLIAALSMGLALTACADLQTISRTTPIPDKIDSEKNREGYEEQLGKAIHLDAQQRLVLATAQGYCAEPSPDALAAYAASLKLGVNVPGTGSGSADQALQSAAASIGLRTQSITLMRDSLYRICEASNNGYLNDEEVVRFLRRSQDLTAVVLAIEQLTGAVAASQVTLPSSVKPDAATNLVSKHQLLDQMEKDVKEKEKAVEDVQSDLDTAETEPSKTDAIKTAKTKLKSAQERLKDAKKVRDRIKEFRDEAIKNTSTETAGPGQCSTVVQCNQLSGRTTEAISNAVWQMVEKVLDKPYTTDICLSKLDHIEKDLENKLAGIRKFFLKLEEKKIFKKIFSDLSKDIQTVSDVETALLDMKDQFKNATKDEQKKRAIKQTQEFLEKIEELQEYENACLDFVKTSIRPQNVPEAPKLNATPENTAITLAWIIPNDGGTAITGYEYRQSTNEGATWSLDWTPIPNSGASTTSHTITDLTNGTAYTFEVRAQNAVGSGEVSTSVSATPRTTPEAPIDLKATPKNTEVTLSWTTPSDDGGTTITGYAYRQSPDKGITWSPDWTLIPSSGANTTTHTVKGLSNGTAYTFEVQAQNAAGAGTASKVSATPATVPSALGNLKATDGNTVVTLTWCPPNDGGRVITQYQYRQKTGSGSFSAWQDIPSSGVGETNETHYMVKDLTNGTAYTFEVRAKNAVGTGDEATSSVSPMSNDD